MATMTHTVTLNPELSAKIDDMIAQGRCTSAQEVIAYSIDLTHQETTSLSQYSPSALAHLDEGVAQVRRGELVSQEEVEAFFSHWRSQLAK